MGIPLYYKHLVSSNPEIINKVKDKNINNLLFDLNCAIHPCCAGKTNENEMFLSILEKINDCIELTGVKDIIYIAIDGPAPRMKMEQQRQRRLKSSQEKKLWDTNQITPGTPFMERLNKFLTDKLNTFQIMTVFSDSNEPGEGEHKIMEFLDENVEKDSISVVYGLDADLIMLSMIRKHNIYLLRERTEYNIENLNSEYIYLDVQLLKNCVVENIKDTGLKDIIQISDDKILRDYLFFSFLIGNDFITPSPCNLMRYGGNNHLEKVYADLQKDFFGMFYLIEDDHSINKNNFYKFIELLSIREKNIIDTSLSKRNHNERRNRNRFGKYLEKVKSIEDIYNYSEEDFKNIHNERNNYEEFKRFSPSIFRENEDIIFKNNNYRKLYYTYSIYNTCNIDPSIDLYIKKDITQICQDYMKSIQWTLDYYFKECPSWTWYYKHNFAPLIIDLKEHITKNNIITFEKDKPYTPAEQLKIVLPNLEKNFMYPLSTPVYSFFKHYMWECHAILPHL